MFVPKGQADQRGLCCHQCCGGVSTEILLGAMSGSMVLLQLESVVMSMACVSTGVIGTMLC